MGLILLLSSIVFVMDRFIKVVITQVIPLGETVSVIPNFFSITNIHNDGAAFSVLSGNRIFLILMTVLFLGIIYVYFMKGKQFKLMEQISLSLLIGGILGNLFDRIFLGYVVDYLSFQLLEYHFPIFNLADICIVISVFFIMIETFKERD